MLNKKRSLIKRMMILTTIICIGLGVTHFASGLTIWRFSDGATEKIIEIATSPGSNSDAKLTVPVGAVVENIKLKLKQRLLTTEFIWIPLSYYAAGNDKIAQINVSDGSLVRLWDSGNNPSRLAISPDGNEVWVANRDSSNMTKIDVSAGTSNNYAVMGGPRAVTFDKNGDVWIGGGSTVMKLDRNGNLLLTLDATSNESYLGTFTYGADTDPDGYVWFVGRGNGKVSRINPDNCDSVYCEIDEFYIGPELYGIGIDSTGDIWLGSGWDHQIYKVAGSSKANFGAVTVNNILGYPPARLTRGVAVDTNDNVWVAINTSGDWSRGFDKVYEFDRNGNFIRAVDTGNGSVGASISIEEGPPGVFTEYVWIINYGDSTINKIRTSNGAIVGTFRADGGSMPGPSWATGKYGSGIDFNGYNDEVVVPNSPSLNPTGAITLEAWVYPTIFDHYDNFISKRISGGEQYILRTYSNTGRIQGYVFVNGGWRADTTPTGSEISLNQWNHVVFTYDGATGKIYINDTDGIPDRSFAYAGNIGAGNDSLRIGSSGGAGDGERFKGKIDEVRIYSRAISSAEVTEHHNGTFNNNTDLVGYWNFDENAGTVANDSSGNNNDGALKSLVFPYNYSNMTGFRGPITELDIGNDGAIEWSVASYVTEAELNSASVASVLTSLAASCTCPGCVISGGDCVIDLTFNSTLRGTIELSSLRAEAPGSIGGFGDSPPPEDMAAGAPSNFKKAVMSIINAVLGFATMIAVLAMIYSGVLSLAAGVTRDPKVGILSRKALIYTLVGITIMGIGYAVVRVIVAVVIK